MTNIPVVLDSWYEKMWIPDWCKINHFFSMNNQQSQVLYDIHVLSRPDEWREIFMKQSVDKHK